LDTVKRARIGYAPVGFVPVCFSESKNTIHESHEITLTIFVFVRVIRG
jgi:hypothetical protein